ncbi:hypothetical protein NW766_006492 [Fusarium irregulare]|uniref:Uncharacterized protein n=1 Tax=Fusarium irregulare TaxID=2494466 RepID=A0A9W8PQ04_9HYPO|nr:hypothetical protein NW766_006492 [Fusarium irregulare]
MTPMLTRGVDQALPPKLSLASIPFGASLVAGQIETAALPRKSLAEWLLVTEQTKKTYAVDPKAPESSLVTAARGFYTSRRAEPSSALPAAPVAPRKAIRFPTLGFPGLQSATVSPEGCCGLGSSTAKTPVASAVCHHRQPVLIDDEGHPIDNQGRPIQGSILHHREEVGGDTPRIAALMVRVIYICVCVCGA